MPAPKPAKGHYSEAEAAASLGVSLEEFRALIRRHIAQNEDDMAQVPATQFHPADLVLLKVLNAARPRSADSAG